MTRRPLTRLTAAALLTVLLAGCGLTDPYQQRTTTAHRTTTTAVTTRADQADPVPERGGAIPRSARTAEDKLAAAAARPTPRAALERYAQIYLNWNAHDVVAVQRELASISLGQARAQALQASVSAARDPELSAIQLANHGQVIAISPGQSSAAGRWVIVTSEQTTGQGDYHGLPPTQHIIYAQLTPTRSGWVVSQWAPQN
jgi:hypothetical protein